jgi:hypothetical protein
MNYLYMRLVSERRKFYVPADRNHLAVSTLEASRCPNFFPSNVPMASFRPFDKPNIPLYLPTKNTLTSQQGRL